MYATNVLLRLSGKIAMDQDGSTPEVRIGCAKSKVRQS